MFLIPAMCFNRHTLMYGLYILVLLKQYSNNIVFLIHQIIGTFTREVCILLKKVAYYLTQVSK